VIPELLAPDSGSAILTNACRLRDFLQAQSDEVERERRLTPQVVEALKAAGCFRMNMPKIWGGPEVPSPEQVEIIEEISKGDASAGWCVMIGCDSGLYSGFVEDGAARRLWPELDMVQAGWVYPIGRAEEVDGGYRVSGRWMFCSGSTHADNIAAGCTVFKDGKPVLHESSRPMWRIMVAPKTQWEVLDTWHTTGLRGTASNDYTTRGESVFVPAEHSFIFTEPKRAGPLWARPDTLLRKMSGIPLGLARRAIDEVSEMMQGKVEMPAGRLYRDIDRVRTGIADANMRLGAARSYVFSSLEHQWRKIEAGEVLTRQERADVWLSRLNAFQAARDVIRTLYDLVGGSAVYGEKSCLDRALRDVETMCQHVTGQRKGLESVGGLLLDLESEPEFVLL
jgi:alkylation response protein AidB-like acyl-CoA dehydrogenase